MNLRKKTLALVAGLMLTTTCAANAVVLDDKSPAQKLRADVANQLAQYKKCLANVVLACEKTGIFPAEAECDLATGVAALPADPRGVFAAQIAKCDAKLDFDKKGPKGNSSVQNYELIGCPNYGAGVRFADMDAFAAAASFLKGTITGYVGGISSASGCTDDKSCKTDAKIILDLDKGLAKCVTACENDYKDKKGNGGPTDDLGQCDSDPAVQACFNKVVGKYLDKAADWPVRDFAAFTVFQAIANLSDAIFNAPDDCN